LSLSDTLGHDDGSPPLCFQWPQFAQPPSLKRLSDCFFDHWTCPRLESHCRRHEWWDRHGDGSFPDRHRMDSHVLWSWFL